MSDDNLLVDPSETLDTEAPPQDPSGDALSEAIRAAQAKLDSAALESSASEEDEAQETAAPAEGAPVVETAPPRALSKLQERLRAREEQHRGRKDYSSKAQELAQERAAVAAEREAVAAEKARMSGLEARLRSHPVRTFQELGVAPDKLMQEAVRETDPQAQARWELEQVRAQVAEQARLTQAIQEQRQKDEQLYQEMMNRQIEQRYLQEAAELAPSARLLYRDDKALVAAGMRVIDQVKLAGQDPSSVTNDDILEWLELEAKEEIARIRNAQPAPGARASSGKTTAPQAKPTQSRRTTLPATAQSERRSTTINFEDLSPDEQQAELVRVTRETQRRMAKAT